MHLYELKCCLALPWDISNKSFTYHGESITQTPKQFQYPKTWRLILHVLYEWIIYSICLCTTYLYTPMTNKYEKFLNLFDDNLIGLYSPRDGCCTLEYTRVSVVITDWFFSQLFLCIVYVWPVHKLPTNANGVSQ